jgi:short-subunit dehydrogenase
MSALADARHADGRPIDLLVNNAGIMSIPTRKLTGVSWSGPHDARLANAAQR